MSSYVSGMRQTTPQSEEDMFCNLNHLPILVQSLGHTPAAEDVESLYEKSMVTTAETDVTTVLKGFLSFFELLV